jgi:hypothetical protein
MVKQITNSLALVDASPPKKRALFFKSICGACQHKIRPDRDMCMKAQCSFPLLVDISNSIYQAGGVTSANGFKNYLPMLSYGLFPCGISGQSLKSDAVQVICK